MCKTGRKINKINFNKFILIYWKMKKIIIIIKFLGSKFESQYSKLYCDRLGREAAQGRTWQARTRPRHGVVGLRYGQACTRHGAQCARLGVGSRYNNCIVAERGATLCHDTVQPRAAIRRSSAPRYGAGGCDTRGRARNTESSALEEGTRLRHALPGLRHDRPGL